MLQVRKPYFCGISAIFFQYCFMNETQVLIAVSNLFGFFSRNYSLEGGFTFQWGEGGFTFQQGEGGFTFQWGGGGGGGGVILKWGGASWGESALIGGGGMGGSKRKSWDGGAPMPPTMENPDFITSYCYFQLNKLFLDYIQIDRQTDSWTDRQKDS